MGRKGQRLRPGRRRGRVFGLRPGNDRDLPPGIQRGGFATRALRGRVSAALRLRRLGSRQARDDKKGGNGTETTATPIGNSDKESRAGREQAAHATPAARLGTPKGARKEFGAGIQGRQAARKRGPPRRRKDKGVGAADGANNGRNQGRSRYQPTARGDGGEDGKAATSRRTP
jgi:hypothetical protein